MKNLGIFVAGGIVGAVAALLLAPRAGADTRVLVVDKVNDVMSDIPGGSDVYDKAAQVYTDAVSKAQGVVSDIKKDVIGGENAVEAEVEVVETAATTDDAKGDELRAKIEAARQRIASQVVKNAQADSPIAAEAKVEEAAPAEADQAAPVEAEEAAPVEAEAAAPAEEAAPAEGEEPAAEEKAE